MVAKILLFAALIYTSAITYFSLIVVDFKVSVGGFDPTDKMLHAGAYLFLAFLWKLYFVFKNLILSGIPPIYGGWLSLVLYLVC